MLRPLAALTFAAGVTFAPPTWAAPLDDLAAAVGIPEVVALMRAEGLDYGAELGRDMGVEGIGPSWQNTVSEIYDAALMEEAVRAGFDEVMGDADLGPLLAFFEDGPGARFVDLELSAREAMLDESVEEAARDGFREMEAAETPRYQLMRDFVEANDLIEWNVEGALNASYAFYAGLSAGGAIDVPEDELLAEVWASEPDVREDTREWVYGFLLMAYGPMSDDDLQAYTDLSQTEAGQRLNRALFRGFDLMYTDISRALGLATARAQQSQEL
ncbi:DUF2059 domain-containing protein [Mesobacterium pallidum]|uniref:DUF2059 domain-containing protein n=1 Tax=Mesobacterium pallidum TaxID=2872037 RepID=UPI001EE1594B|nr:DUF2059 domain-containing protein [Mesobacterium pallidum]